jgi:hypothetical protein
MNLDPQNALNLAFKNLDGFSVPTLGTFKRVRVPAQIDHQKKRILPPQERFVLEPGEEMRGEFEDFLFRFYNIKINEAEELAVEVGNFLHETLRGQGQLRVDGIGTIRKDAAGEIEFVAEEGVLGQAADFFGLQSVEYTFTEGAKATVEKKKEAAKESVLANTTVVEPVRVRRKFPVGWVIFLLILVIGGGAAWKWQAELKMKLRSYGILKEAPEIVAPIGPSESDDFLTAEEKEAMAKIKADSIAYAQAMEDSAAAQEVRLQDSLKAIADAASPSPKVEQKVTPKVEQKVTPKVEAKVTPKVEPKVTPKVEAKVTPKVEPKVTPKVEPKPLPAAIADAMALNDGKYGVRPENGKYYLVISSFENGAEAAEIAKGIAGAKVLVPHYQKGFYKVAVFESTSKSQVISKMVGYKDKFPKSWIFWPGMPVAGN